MKRRIQPRAASTSGRTQRPADTGDRRDRIVEDHRADPADRQVVPRQGVPRQGERVDLRVSLLEGDVLQPFRSGQFTSAF
ncbi:MAG TPA: hypothetical protein VFG35_09320, partial [Actinoplanes sp.]|nr:hypothetical protein [Actinoplanes sp.]